MRFTAYASGSTGNLFTLEDGHTSILIECGLSYRKMQQTLPKPPTSYDACLISHMHKDHAEGAYDLLKRGVQVITGENLQEIVIKVGTFDVRSFPVKHDDEMPCFGYIIRSRVDLESLIFIIDGAYTGTRFDFSATIWAIEANHAQDLLRPGHLQDVRTSNTHMHIGQAISTLLENNLSRTREIHLLHLSDSERSDEARFIREVQGATGIPTYATQAYSSRKERT